jgi:hypothetical protein
MPASAGIEAGAQNASTVFEERPKWRAERCDAAI